MNEIKVRKQKEWYIVFIDDQQTYFADTMQAIVDWLEENFSPPIKVRWFVGTVDNNVIKEKYSY